MAEKKQSTTKENKHILKNWVCKFFPDFIPDIITKIIINSGLIAHYLNKQIS